MLQDSRRLVLGCLLGLLSAAMTLRGAQPALLVESAEPIERTWFASRTGVEKNWQKAGSGSASVSWDVGAVATKAVVSADGSVELTVPGLEPRVMFGSSQDGKGVGCRNIDFVFRLRDGGLHIGESGADLEFAGTFAGTVECESTDELGNTTVNAHELSLTLQGRVGVDIETANFRGVHYLRRAARALSRARDAIEHYREKWSGAITP